MHAAIDGVASRLADAGARVERRLPDLDWTMSNGLFTGLLDAVLGIFAPASRLTEEQRTLAWYLEALDRRDGVVAAWEAFFEDVDVLLLPPAMTPAFPHAEQYGTIDVDGRAVSYLEHGQQLVFANLAGLPALAAPAGLDPHGLPTGVQLVGPRWSDERLITIARAMEAVEVLPGFHPPPGR
jgi:amidase